MHTEWSVKTEKLLGTASSSLTSDRIYICGGFDGQECLQTAEYYNPTTNQWTMIPPMRSQRSGVGQSPLPVLREDSSLNSGVIAYRGSVYAIGGFNGTARLNTGERYNPVMNSWRPIADMFHPRSNFAIEVVLTMKRNMSEIIGLIGSR